jgi:hypothetical protein
MSQRRTVLVVLAISMLSTAVVAEKKEAETRTAKIPAGSKVYVAAMADGFDTYVKAAIEKKKVPLTVTENRDQADYEITGTSETQKAGAAKILIMGSFHSAEQASIRVSNLKTGEVAWAYSVNKQNSAHGKQSTAEACAKHLKDAIEKQ